VEDFAGGPFLLTTIVGAVVGFVAGMFGIGGGFLIVPILNIALGFPMQIAVGSAACQVLGPATTSVLARRVMAQDFRLPLIVTGGLLMGVFAGAAVLHRLMTPSADVEFASRTGEAIVLMIYLVLLLALGGFALWESGRVLAQRPVRTGWMAHWNLPPYAVMRGLPQPMSITILAWFGLFVGFVSGFLGISGGLLLLPGLIYLLGLAWHQAVTTSTLIVWLVAFQSTIAHSIHDHIRLPIVLGLLLGGTVGARMGVDWSRGLSAAHGRKSFAWLALGTAAMIGVKLVLY